MLSLQAVHKSYPHPAGAVSVLRDLSVEVGKGETVAVVGPSGSGKSTLLALLAGLDRPTTGKVALFGEDVTKLSEKQLTVLRAKNLGIVFQQFHLMGHLTAAENVALPLEILEQDDATSRAEAALTAVGLGERTHHFPYQMSGGECQRVAIARAMIASPPLILADEPSGNLDVKTGEAVMQLLFDRVKAVGATLILVTHNEELARRCQRRLVLSGGKLIDG